MLCTGIGIRNCDPLIVADIRWLTANQLLQILNFLLTRDDVGGVVVAEVLHEVLTNIAGNIH